MLTTWRQLKTREQRTREASDGAQKLKQCQQAVHGAPARRHVCLGEDEGKQTHIPFCSSDIL